MVGFYETLTGQPAQWLAPVFAKIITPGATLAMGSAETVALVQPVVPSRRPTARR